MARIQITHLSFTYDGSFDPVFRDVSLQLDTDWKLGLVGRNGRGKTTLLRLMSGQLPDRGAISMPVPCDYFLFPIQDERKTPLQLAEDLTASGEAWRFMKEAAALEISPEALSRPYATLSGGERVKTLLAILFSREAHFLLIDEPTNHLDLAGRRVVSRYLNGKRGFLLVSHDRAFLDGCVDHILSINRDGIELQKGNFSTWEENRRRQDQFEWNENERLKKSIATLKSAAVQAHIWADRAEKVKIGIVPGGREKSMDARAYYGEKSRRMQQRRKNLETRIEREIEEKEGLLHNLEKQDSLKIFPMRHPASRLVSLREVSLSFDGRPVLDKLTMDILQGRIIALEGKNGSGKTTLLRLLAGEIQPDNGEIRTASGLILSIVPQRAVLSGTLDDFIRQSGIDGTQFLTILRKLDFRREQFEKDMRDFSAGQMKKALIARSLCQKAHLYLWDEPLNYVDVISRMQIEELLLSFRPTMVLAEHDQRFLSRIGARILHLPEGRWEEMQDEVKK